MSNGKINGANMLALGKHTKVSTVTFHKTIILVPHADLEQTCKSFHGDLFAPELALGRLVCHVCMTSSFFFLTICFFFHMLNWIFTKLGQKHVWVYGYKTYGSKNSFGVTGVKNVNNMKNMKTAPIQNLIMSSCRQ